MVGDKIQKHIEEVLDRLDLPDMEVELEHPAEEANGDYATNVAMVVAGKVKKSPRELAEEILKELQKNKRLSAVFSKIEVAGPGFINFWLSKDYLVKQSEDVIKQEDKYGFSEYFKDKKVMVEYTDPNPFKEFHIGHLYSNIVGESLCRLFEVQGAKVKRVNYQGDVGLHVAKAVWGMQTKIKNEKLKMNGLGKASLADKAKFMGEAYAFGATAFKEDPQAKDEIDKLNKKIYDLDPSIKDLYEEGRKWSLEYFEKIYRRLGTKFDFYYFEREAGEKGLKYVKKYQEKGIFTESEGAVVFKGEKYGLHTRVFINSAGLPTYEAKDLGLAPTKFQDFPYDLSIVVTGNEIDEYFRVVLKALEMIDPTLRAKTLHISHGMVRLPRGKMSSRTGEVITGEWLLDEAKKRVVEIIKGGDKITEVDTEQVSEVVAVGAVKYALLKSNIGRDVIFDFKETLNLEGNSGPYLQYTYARARSVLSKSETNSKFKIQNSKLAPEERAILRTLYKFPEVVLEAGKNYAPNLICNFLFDLAQRYNTFYNKHKIIGGENEKLRILLTAATAQILKNGLNLLGIKTLEKM